MPDLRERDRRILEAVYNNGAEANTPQIKQFTGIEKNGIIRHSVTGDGKLADQGLVDWEIRETEEHPNPTRFVWLTPAGMKVCERFYDDEEGEDVPLTDIVERLRRDVQEYREDVDEFLTVASDATVDAEDARREAVSARDAVERAEARIEEIATDAEADVEEAVEAAEHAEYTAERAIEKAEKALETQRENDALRDRLDAVDSVVDDLRDLGLVEGDVESGLDRGPFLRRIEEDVRPGLMDRLEQLDATGAFEPFRHLSEEEAKDLAAVANDLDVRTLSQGLLEQRRVEKRRDRDLSDEEHLIGPITDALAEFGGVATESELARRLYTSEAVVRGYVESLGARSRSRSGSRSAPKVIGEETDAGRRVYTFRWVDYLLREGGEATVEDLQKHAYDGLTEEAARSSLLNVGGREGLLGSTFAAVEEGEDGETRFRVHPHCRYWLRPGYDRPEEEAVEEAEEKAEEKAENSGLLRWSR